MKVMWFKIHKFWGYYPIRFEGYLTILVFFVSFISIFLLTYFDRSSVTATIYDSFPLMSLVFSLTILIVFANGPKPKFGRAHQNTINYTRDHPKAYLSLALLFLAFCILYLLQTNIFGGGLLFLTFFILYKSFLLIKS